MNLSSLDKAPKTLNPKHPKPKVKPRKAKPAPGFFLEVDDRMRRSRPLIPEPPNPQTPNRAWGLGFRFWLQGYRALGLKPNPKNQDSKPGDPLIGQDSVKLGILNVRSTLQEIYSQALWSFGVGAWDSGGYLVGMKCCFALGMSRSRRSKGADNLARPLI